MKQQKTELMELFETHLNRTTDKLERSGLKSFRQKICVRLKADYTNIKLHKVNEIKEVKQFVKQENIENYYLFLVYKTRYSRLKAVLINPESKSKFESLNYYDSDIVKIKQALNDEATLYVIYSDKSEQKRIETIQKNRQNIKKGTWLDGSSIYHRCRDRYGNKDHAGFVSQIDKIFTKYSYTFIDHDVNYLVNHISNKEQKLFKYYQEVRNRIFTENKNIYLSSIDCCSLPDFNSETSAIREAILQLQNINTIVKKYIDKYPEENAEDYKRYLIKDCRRTIARNYIYIMEKELRFKNDVNDFVNRNTK